MELLFWILAFSFVGSMLGLAGGFLLLINEKLTNRFAFYLVSFSAGALLSAAFLHLLPEALEETQNYSVLSYTLFGIVLFFILEKYFLWYHHHKKDHRKHTHTFTNMILLGDAIHNFIDGVIIAATFLVSIPLGIITSIAAFLHEVPQEIGDFAVLLYGGMKRKRIIALNLLTALATFVGAVLTFFFAFFLEGFLFSLVAFAAGNFIYIASSDLIPETHANIGKGKNLIHIFLFLLGIFVMYLMTTIIHS